MTNQPTCFYDLQQQKLIESIRLSFILQRQQNFQLQTFIPRHFLVHLPHPVHCIQIQSRKSTIYTHCQICSHLGLQTKNKEHLYHDESHDHTCEDEYLKRQKLLRYPLLSLRSGVIQSFVRIHIHVVQVYGIRTKDIIIQGRYGDVVIHQD